ncbi:MAG: hypothetical protein FWF99_00625 [Desulfovibrionaceae bacterium]|nr:hypothetical protein [Desulfovibrionaceae bacterium]
MITRICSFLFSGKGAILPLLALAGAAWGLFQHQAGRIRDLSEQTALLSFNNSSLAMSNAALREAGQRDGRLLAEAADRAAKYAELNKTLDHRLNKALQDAKNTKADYSFQLSDDLTDALCLRWFAASGKAGADFFPAPGAFAAGETHPPAAGCAAWRGRVNLGEALLWTGLLLEHAGQERLDKAALREWAARERTP